MNFDLTDDQKMLVNTARDFARKSSPVSRMRQLRDSELGFERQSLAQMGELGWLGVAYPEEVGGMGMSFVELALVLVELGKSLVPEPVLESAVLGGLPILWAGNAEQQRRWLPDLCAGEAIWSLAWAERGSRFDAGDCATRAERRGAAAVLTGSKVWVLGGHAADHFVVSAHGEAGLGLYVVERGAPGLEIIPLMTIDSRGAAHLQISGVEAVPLAGADPAAALQRVLDAGAAAACAEGLGVAQASLDMTVEYLKTREQFGTVIGSFQALQHRAVDMFVEVELCRSAAIEAMIRVAANDRERAAACSAAMVQLATGGRFVVRQAIQLHGGIGITDEHDIGLYLKRMQALTCALGDEHHHLARFAGRPEFLS
jgi:alkylation response protein AidB-like acyl-CoA dehydrogenase